MSIYAGPEILNDGLVLCLDAGNTKTFSKPGSLNNHGYSTWYCFVSATATYSIIDPNVTIYQNTNGTITTMVSPSSSPQRGTFSVTAGSTYYGNGPIFLVVEDGHQCLAPLSMAGTEFFIITARNNPGTVYLYALTATTVSFYNNPTNGFNSAATSTVSMNAGTSTTINLPDIVNYFIKSTQPIIATTTQNGADKTILSPMSNIVYNRYLRDGRTSINTTPLLRSGNVVYDPNYTVMDQTIADGSGGDTAQSLSLANLSDTYSFGNALSDYGIAAPYDNTTVVTSYWNGSSWVVLETHSLLGGTLTQPAYQYRDGNAGPGVAGSNLSGAVANFASGATGPWRWVGNKPFYLCINDTADDELSMLGWCSFMPNLTQSGANGTLVNGVTYSSDNGGTMIFDGSNDYINVSGFNVTHGTSNFTYSCWVNLAAKPGLGTIFENGSWTNCILFRYETNGITVYSMGSYFGKFTFNPNLNTWNHLTFVRDSNNMLFYLNGSYLEQISFGTSLNVAPSPGNLFIGSSQHTTGQMFNGKINLAMVYTSALSASQIAQNFNAQRSRYGI